jgi:hypothetical protein
MKSNFFLVGEVYKYVHLFKLELKKKTLINLKSVEISNSDDKYLEDIKIF